MAVMRTSDFPELLDTPLRKVFFLSLKQVPAEYSRWINIVETRRNFEDDLRMAEFGAIGQHVEGTVPKFEEALEGDTKRYTPLEFAHGYIITETMREDDQHGIMVRMTEALRRSVRHLYEVQGYNPLNNATSTASSRFTGFDGLALLSTAHTMLEAANQANKPTTDVTLSQLAVEAAVKAFHGWYGEKALPGFFTPRRAIVGSNDQYVAARLFKNAMRADTANHEENWIRKGPDDNGINEFIVSRYFTAQNQWFILGDQHDINMFIRVHPQFETRMEFLTGNLQAKCRTRLITSFGRWFDVYGSKGY